MLFRSLERSDADWSRRETTTATETVKGTVSVEATLETCNAVAWTWRRQRVPPAPHRGWMWTPRKDAVSVDSEKRNHVFYVGEDVVFNLGQSADNYEVRDYWGDIVDSGPAGSKITVNAEQPGWYKLYVYGEKPEGDEDPGVAAWGEVVGGTTFVIFPNDDRFPPLPGKDVPGGHEGRIDQVLRGVTGIGPQRYAVHQAENPETWIESLEIDVAIDKEYYLPYDPVRRRALMVAFPNGTKGRLDGVRKIVEHFKDDIHYWEPRNEPNFGATGAEFVKNEMIDFYETVKSVDPDLKVMGPGTVTINPGPNGLGFIEDFLKAGGGDYIDVFSFHPYNGIVGDLTLIRKSMDGLKDLLRKYGLGDIELWQTEQGHMAAMYGTYSPRRQGRWTMLQMLAYEQYGLPKEQNHWWYDRSHGFWDFPSWWINDDGSLNPAGPLMRVYSEEIYGKLFNKAYEFGPAGENMYLGNLYTGEDGSVAAFMSAGDPCGSITLEVNGTDTLHVVSAFGVESILPVENARVQLPVPEIPVYVRLAGGQQIEVVPMDYGTDLALAEGVTAASSGDGLHPVNPDFPNDIGKVFNGKLDTIHWTNSHDNDVWYDNTKGFPAWIVINLPQVQQVGRVIIYSGVPHSWRGTLLDYELQYDRNGEWVTIEHVTEDPKTFAVFTPPIRCTVDSFFSERWIFHHHFEPVQTQKIRLLVHDATYGGGPNKAFDDVLGQGPHQFQLREVEIYGK